ncbi:hypothetical protein CAY59_26880 (plasmid) [Vibrio campbellii]|uniref:hypothetical protein n=1 Tax=Vibrio campbellii TaxID=680 RepID=UPI000A2FB8D2|nr:hypothetical protein [Vibrio campbellii]ARR47856.1 hypothetical protein CAY59_26880 [Vibrio campbellii]
MKQTKKQAVNRVTIAHALRDVLIKAMDEAMLAPFAIVVWGTIVLYKIPEESMAVLLHEMLDVMGSSPSLGWGVALLCLIMWGGQVYLIQKQHRRDMDEIRRRAATDYNRKLKKSKVKV